MLVDCHQDVFVYFCVPEGVSPDVLAQIRRDRILPVPIPSFRTQYEDMLLIPGEVVARFNDPDGDYYLDVVVCDKVAGLAYARAALSNSVGPYGRDPIWCANCEYLIDKQRASFVSDALGLSHAMGLLAADVCYWGSYFIQKRGVEHARHWLYRHADGPSERNVPGVTRLEGHDFGFQGPPK